jgi:hypothetical protein
MGTMKKLLITLAALGSLAALSSLALPALAASGAASGACAAMPADLPTDINAMPAGPVVGHQSIKGAIGDDGCGGSENEGHQSGHSSDGGSGSDD